MEEEIIERKSVGNKHTAHVTLQITQYSSRRGNY